MEYPSFSTPTAGSIRFNTDSKKLEIYNGEKWWEVDSNPWNMPKDGGRIVWGSGRTSSSPQTLQHEYITISSTGNALDFGDTTMHSYESGACASGTRGVMSVAQHNYPGTVTSNAIEYVTIMSTGNSIDFGDMMYTVNTQGTGNNSVRGVWSGGKSTPSEDYFNYLQYSTIATLGNTADFGDFTFTGSYKGAASSSTRAVYAGGNNTPSPFSSGSATNRIDYIQIMTLGNALDFGDLTAARGDLVGFSSGVRGVFAGGDKTNTIDYVQISSLGNATDFGDLTVAIQWMGASSSKTRGVIAGGRTPTYLNTMGYVTITTTGNATDFGDLLTAEAWPRGMSNCHGGLGVSY